MTFVVNVEPALSPLPEGSIAAALACARLALAAVAALAYLCLASMWVGCAGWATAAVSMTVALTIGRPALVAACLLVANAALRATAGALILLGALLATSLLGLCCGILAKRVEISFPADRNKNPGVVVGEFLHEPRWKLLLRERDTVVLGVLASAPFFLLSLAGSLMVYLSPVRGSQVERIGSLILYVGGFVVMAIFCSIVIPAVVLRTWRTLRAVKQAIEEAVLFRQISEDREETGGLAAIVP